MASTLAAQAPENVLVVVNRNSPLSTHIGDYYARRRAIPPANLCRIQAPVGEEITRAGFEHSIEAPVGACLNAGGIREKITFLVTTAGVPLKIAGSDGTNGDRASVDSELTLLYGKLEGRRYPTAGAVPNPFFGQRRAAFAQARFPIYLVTRLDGYDFALVRASIDRSLEAVNRGKVVLDLRAEDDQMGNDWLRDTAIRLPGDRVLIDQSREVIYGQRDVIGYAGWGSNDPGRRRRLLGFQWLPGAIATDYVSYSARTFLRPPKNWTLGLWRAPSSWFAGSPQSLAADYLEEGATGVSGNVYEPYLDKVARPDHLFPAYLDGRTLGESYWLSLPALSWMNVVVGDPLCRLAAPRAQGDGLESRL